MVLRGKRVLQCTALNCISNTRPRIYVMWKREWVSQVEYQGIAQACRDAIKKAKAQLKLKLVGNLKDEKLLEHIIRKSKAKENMSMLWGWDPSDSQKDEMLNTFSALAFTDKVCKYTLWRFKPCERCRSETLQEIEKDRLGNHFSKLHIDGMGWDGMLWVLPNVIARPLSTILKRLWHSEEVPDVWNKANTTCLFRKSKKEHLRKNRMIILTLVSRKAVGTNSLGSYIQTHRGLEGE